MVLHGRDLDPGELGQLAQRVAEPGTRTTASRCRCDSAASAPGSPGSNRGFAQPGAPPSPRCRTAPATASAGTGSAPPGTGSPPQPRLHLTRERLDGCARARGRGGWARWPAMGSRSARTRRRRPAGPRPGCAGSPRRSWTAPGRPQPATSRTSRRCRARTCCSAGRSCQIRGRGRGGSRHSRARTPARPRPACHGHLTRTQPPAGNCNSPLTGVSVHDPAALSWPARGPPHQPHQPHASPTRHVINFSWMVTDPRR